MSENRYYWLKLKDDFFTSKRIKKLRNLAGGDTLTIIYLKMQLKSIKTGGILSYTGLEKTFAEELALDLDESPDNVGLLLNYLLSVGLIETSDNINFFLPYAVENTGSEGSSAKRMREFREREKLPLVAEASQSDAGVTQMCEHRYGEKEIEKEIEIEIDNSAKSRTKFSPPTLEEVTAYCEERKNGVDPQRWFDFYLSKNFMVGKNKMRDWKASIRTWERSGGKDSKEKGNEFWEAVRRLAEE